MKLSAFIIKDIVFIAILSEHLPYQDSSQCPLSCLLPFLGLETWRLPCSILSLS